MAVLGIKQRTWNFTIVNIILIIVAVALVGNALFSIVDWVLALIGIPYAQQIVTLILVLIVDTLFLYFVYPKDLLKRRFTIYVNAIFLFAIYLLLDWLILQDLLTELSLIALGI